MSEVKSLLFLKQIRNKIISDIRLVELSSPRGSHCLPTLCVLKRQLWVMNSITVIKTRASSHSLPPEEMPGLYSHGIV